jgi:hypothetical protein
MQPMPIALISIPDDQRSDFLDALGKLDLPAGAVVEDVPDNPGSMGIDIEDSEDPSRAAERVGQIIDAANEVAGRAFHAVGGGAYWPQTGETL